MTTEIRSTKYRILFYQLVTLVGKCTYTVKAKWISRKNSNNQTLSKLVAQSLSVSVLGHTTFLLTHLGRARFLVVTILKSSFMKTSMWNKMVVMYHRRI